MKVDKYTSVFCSRTWVWTLFCR